MLAELHQGVNFFFWHVLSWQSPHICRLAEDNRDGITCRIQVIDIARVICNDLGYAYYTSSEVALQPWRRGSFYKTRRGGVRDASFLEDHDLKFVGIYA